MKKIMVLTLWFLFIITGVSFGDVYRTEEDLGINKNFWITPWVKKAALSTPKVDSREKIYDYADLLTEKEEKELLIKIKSFIEETNMDMAIVTILDNPKKKARDFADDFYDYNDFGTDSVYSGVLFLIDMETREMWLSTTGNAILMYNDIRINDILDKSFIHIYSSYYDTIDTFVNVSKDYALSGLPDGNKNYYIDESGRYRKQIENVDYIVATITCAVMSAIITSIIVSKQAENRKVEEAEFYEKKFKYNKNADRIISKDTQRYDVSYLNSDDVSGSGGSYQSSRGSSSNSSSSSTHLGSSGTTHGGSGRRF